MTALAERAGRAALAGVGLPAEGFAISVMGCDDARIAALNADFRGKPQPTNVLSWPSEDRAAEVVGDAPDLPDAGRCRGPRIPGRHRHRLGDLRRARPRRRASRWPIM